MNILQLLRWYLRPIRIIKQILINQEPVPFRREKEKICWIIGSADHKNLGDHAITYATKMFVKSVAPNCQIIEIPEGKCYQWLLHVSRTILPSDLIVLQGGGNFGDQYIYIEQIRRTYVTFFKKNHMILFPQTIYFSDTSLGRRELRLSQRIYQRNKRLVLFAREKKSFELMRQFFRNSEVHLCPDIVMSLLYRREMYVNVPRHGCLICIRSDAEGTINKDAASRLISDILRRYKGSCVIDTIADHMICPEEREKVIAQIWDVFAQSELVVTDRLHGMIFAALQNTPCIVIGNYNHKVAGCYEWLANYPEIVFVDDITKIDDGMITSLRNLRDYLNPALTNELGVHFEVLKRLIKNNLE